MCVSINRNNNNIIIIMYIPTYNGQRVFKLQFINLVKLFVLSR